MIFMYSRTSENLLVEDHVLAFLVFPAVFFVMRHILLTKGFLQAHSAQDIHLTFREGCNSALVNVSAMVGCRGIAAKSNICTLLRVTWSPVCGIFLKLM